MILITIRFLCLIIGLFFSAFTFASTSANPPENEKIILDDDWTIEGENEPSKNRISFAYYYNPDLYYSNCGILLNLTQKPIPDVGKKHESSVYFDLLKRSLVPRFVLFELSVNPMPLLGVYLRKNQNKFYETSVFSGFNLIESITAGFEEPYALSLFLNNMVTYNTAEKSEKSNVGFMGYLVTGSNYHIQRNRLVKDNWIEIEWKIKGDIQKENDTLSWSFRIGSKFHSHSDISDIFFLSLRRSQIARTGPILSWLLNSGFEFTYNVSQSNFKTVEMQLVLSKKIPIKLARTSLSVDFGIVHETNQKYSGSLLDRQKKDEKTIFILRPGIEF